MCDRMREACHVTFEALLRGVKEIKEDQAKLFKAVLGNGDPSNSISSRLTRVETQVTEGRGARDRFWKAASVGIACVAVLIAWLK